MAQEAEIPYKLGGDRYLDLLRPAMQPEKPGFLSRMARITRPVVELKLRATAQHLAKPIIPAKAGIQTRVECTRWIPAYAGMTWMTTCET